MCVKTLWHFLTETNGNVRARRRRRFCSGRSACEALEDRVLLTAQVSSMAVQSKAATSSQAPQNSNNRQPVATRGAVVLSEAAAASAILPTPTTTSSLNSTLAQNLAAEAPTVPFGTSESAIPNLGSSNPFGSTLDDTGPLMSYTPPSDTGLLNYNAATTGAASDNGFTALSAGLGPQASLSPALPQNPFPDRTDSAQAQTLTDLSKAELSAIWGVFSQPELSPEDVAFVATE